VRELRLVGPGADGGALVVDLDGEQLRLPLDRRLIAAVRAATGAAPLTGAGTAAVDQDAWTPDLSGERPAPRDIQRRIRAGESAPEVAARSGADLAWVDRFAGPPLAERDHQARRARAAVIDAGSLDAATLEERVAGYAAAVGADPGSAAGPDWDAWLAEDGDWRVVAVLPGGLAACWAWRPAAARLTPVERTARLITPGLGGPGDGDLLQAVLRPVGAPRQEPATPSQQSAGLPAPARRGRAAVPSWEEIASTTTRPDP